MAQPNRQELAANRLGELSEQSMPFYEARQKLLDQGFSPDEIACGAYMYHRTQEPEESPDDSEKIKAYLTARPEAADKIANAFISLDKTKTGVSSSIGAFGKHVMTQVPAAIERVNLF
ncbi:MAG TPA: hypothetical protein VLG37_02020 [Candidatus Saccharimonadales bacterium]|nr:hypothetical protein [Candidatus Saccharimonadales bacterium]